MSSLEAKIVVLGAQGVGKTSLVTRFCRGSFDPAKTSSTVGASFLTKRVVDADTDTTVRLQIWDTAGQERFRSISRLYYRGANACILCYSITDAHSFADMGDWLAELRRNLPSDVVLHVVGTKADLVARDPTRREVPFERCIAYVAENLAPGRAATPPSPALTHAPPASSGAPTSTSTATLSSFFATAPPPPPPVPSATPAWPGVGDQQPRSPSSKRSSGFWGQEAGWDACHEISAESGEGVDEVFRVVTRKLVEQNRRLQQALLIATAQPGSPGYETGMDGGFFGDTDHHHHHHHLYPSAAASASSFASAAAAASAASSSSSAAAAAAAGGSFRIGRDRRSWLLMPSPFTAQTLPTDQPTSATSQSVRPGRSHRCC